MIRQIITSENNQLLLQIPNEYVGKAIEVIAFRIDQENDKNTEYSWESALAFFASHKVSISNYRFNRDEANER